MAEKQNERLIGTNMIRKRWTEEERRGAPNFDLIFWIISGKLQSSNKNSTNWKIVVGEFDWKF